MRVLVIGKGAREHALAWKLTDQDNSVFVVPGNGGTALMEPRVRNIDHDMFDFPGLVELSKKLAIDLVIPGPDDVVAEGIADAFDQAGIACFAPSKVAAELEGSKAFAKDFMSRHGIPTAEHRTFEDYDAARDYLSSITHRVVIKVSGLAAGKGVVLPETAEEAQSELRQIMLERKFGTAGEQVVIEEFLVGDEISILTFCDPIGAFRSLPPGQDHKRVYDGSKGPNTGGMGVYGPTDFVSNETLSVIEQTILGPTLEGLKAEGRPFRGMLFTGVMLTANGPKVLEYNVRFGDPETQSLLLLLKSDLAQLCLSCTSGSLQHQPFEIHQGYACNVVISSAGYPGPYNTGYKIKTHQGPESSEVHMFHAGTALSDGVLRTTGGRVFSVAAVGATLQEAVNAAYEGTRSVHFSGMHFRKDIASRSLE